MGKKKSNAGIKGSAATKDSVNSVNKTGAGSMDTTDILAMIRTYLSDHPANYNDCDSLFQFLYWRYTSYNCEENEEAQKKYNDYIQKVTELCERVSKAEGALDGSAEGMKKLTVLDPIQNELNQLLSIQTESAYIEGMKLGMRMMIELYG